MIDKITITLDDTGKWVVNSGDMSVVITDKPQEVLLWVNANMRKLAYFPQWPMQHPPMELNEFKKPKKNESTTKANNPD